MYAGAGGMIIGLHAADVFSNNLANASTPGFRLDRATVGSFQSVLLPQLTTPGGQPASIAQSATMNPTVVDLSQGPLQPTHNPLDVAIDGPGWFAVGTGAGESYTRDGHFELAPDGTLQTPPPPGQTSGYPVLGTNGPIVVPTSDPVTINEAGQVFSGANLIGQLKLVRFTDATSVVKQGNNLVTGGAPVADTASTVRQGMMEGSNADTMRMMVDMMAMMRYVEMNQKIIQAQDQSLGQVIDIARH
jgi:flagellar basal body rod protein FlgG